MNGKPSASVYWTYYGTTDLLDQALAAGCSSKLDIQRYVWAHRQEASNSGSAYVYQASEAGWQNVMTRYPPVDQPTEPDQPEETPPPTYDANWSVNVSESASAEFAVSMTVAVDKTAAITGERLGRRRDHGHAHPRQWEFGRRQLVNQPGLRDHPHGQR